MIGTKEIRMQVMVFFIVALSTKVNIAMAEKHKVLSVKSGCCSVVENCPGTATTTNVNSFRHREDFLLHSSTYSYYKPWAN